MCYSRQISEMKNAKQNALRDESIKEEIFFKRVYHKNVSTERGRRLSLSTRRVITLIRCLVFKNVTC